MQVQNLICPDFTGFALFLGSVLKCNERYLRTWFTSEKLKKNGLRRLRSDNKIGWFKSGSSK